MRSSLIRDLYYGDAGPDPMRPDDFEEVEVIDEPAPRRTPCAGKAEARRARRVRELEAMLAVAVAQEEVAYREVRAYYGGLHLASLDRWRRQCRNLRKQMGAK